MASEQAKWLMGNEGDDGAGKRVMIAEFEASVESD